MIEPSLPAFTFCGMDIRTYIATAALHGLLANAVATKNNFDIIVEAAVNLSDLLIAELNKADKP